MKAPSMLGSGRRFATAEPIRSFPDSDRQPTDHAGDATQTMTPIQKASAIREACSVS